jgi:hypothetical protein
MRLKADMKTVAYHVGVRRLLCVSDRLRRRMIGAPSPFFPKAWHTRIDSHWMIVVWDLQRPDKRLHAFEGLRFRTHQGCGEGESEGM